MRQVERRIRALEDARKAERFGKVLQHISDDDLDWLVNRPYGPSGVDLPRWTPEEIERGEAIMVAAYKAADAA
jgi:hypothetical protein